jgi:hypothetical protein
MKSPLNHHVQSSVLKSPEFSGEISRSSFDYEKTPSTSSLLGKPRYKNFPALWRKENCLMKKIGLMGWFSWGLTRN